MARHGLFTKEQLSKRHDVADETVDFYAARGLLQPINLHDGVFFTSSDFLRLEIILKGKRLGLSLDEIKLLMERAKRSI